MLSATLRSSSKLRRLQHVIPPPSIPATHRHARTRFGKARVKALVFTSDEEAEMATRMPQYASRRARDFTGELDADVEYVASYDWDAEAKKPTITVPGHPPILKGFEFYIPPSLASPRQTDADDPRRPSAHRAGRSPVSYLPRATLAASDALGTSSSIDWRALDFIVDYGVIRKIMLRVQLGDRAEMTELALERLGDKTFVLNSGPKDEFSLGFGHARRGLYELAVDGKPGRTHIRVIRTTFFGMNMLVSFPVYACKPDTSSLSTTAAAAEEAGGTNSDLLGLKIVHGGFGASVPHSALANFSIPTHDHRNVGEFRSLLPHRMIAHSFLSAYPIMYHYPGALDEHMIMQISEIDLVRGYALEYRSRQRNAFERFARVFEIVRKEARRFGEGARCRVRMDGRSVVVDQWKKPPVLVPPKARARFE